MRIVDETVRFAKEGYKELQKNPDSFPLKLLVVELRVAAVAAAALTGLFLLTGPAGLPLAALSGIASHHFYRIGENIADSHLRSVPNTLGGAKRLLAGAINQFGVDLGVQSRQEAEVRSFTSYLEGTIPGFILNQLS